LVLGRPATAITSFAVNGTPCNGPSVSPRASVASAARASSRAWSMRGHHDRVHLRVACVDARRVSVEQLHTERQNRRLRTASTSGSKKQKPNSGIDMRLGALRTLLP
jgi:hypothetical protein